MGDAPLHRDHVELLDQVRGLAQQLRTVLVTHLFVQHHGRQEDAVAVLAQLLGQRAVVDLADHARAQLLAPQPLRQAHAQGRVAAGHQHGRVVQALREGRLDALGQLMRGVKTHGRATQAVVVGVHAERRRQGCVRQDQVQPVHRQLGQQAVELALATDDLEGLLALQGGLQQVAGHHLGNGVGDAHAQLERARRALGLAHHLVQLGPQVEDVLRVAEGQLTRVGERQLAAFLLEQGAAEVVFQQLDLAADGLRRDVQVLAGLDHATQAGDGPEVQQVLVVHRDSRSVRVDISNLHAKPLGLD